MPSAAYRLQKCRLSGWDDGTCAHGPSAGEFSNEPVREEVLGHGHCGGWPAELADPEALNNRFIPTTMHLARFASGRIVSHWLLALVERAAARAGAPL